MRHLALYPEVPVAPGESDEPRLLDPSCKRCEFHKGARTVCMPADGEPGGLQVLEIHHFPVRSAAHLIRKAQNGAAAYEAAAKAHLAHCDAVAAVEREQGS